MSGTVIALAGTSESHDPAAGRQTGIGAWVGVVGQKISYPGL